MRRNGAKPLGTSYGKILLQYIGLSFLCWSLCLAPALGSAPVDPNSEVPVKGMVTVVGICSERCVPCKMMEPLLQKLEAEYRGRFALVCLDKDKNKDLAARFNARVTPTMVFFDKDGREVYRHEGVMDKNDVLATLKKAGMQ